MTMRCYCDVKLDNTINWQSKVLDAIVYSITVWVVLFVVFFSSSTVYDISMQPTLNPNGATEHDIVYYDRTATPVVGDIVVIGNGDNGIIKRVVAIAGDRVRYQYDNVSESYVLFINNEPVTEEYTKEIITPAKLMENLKKNYYICTADPSGYNPLATLYRDFPDQIDSDGNYIVPDGTVFALGDNRINSIDSKMQGGYKTTDIIGVVKIIIPEGKNTFFEILKYLFTFNR